MRQPWRAGRHRRRSFRSAAVLLHRWVGLVIALFLVSAGVTGSLLAFNDELEAWFAPQLFRVEPLTPEAQRMGPFELRALLLQQYPHSAIHWVDLQPPRTPRDSVHFSLEAGPDADAAPLNDQIFVDPYTGTVVGERRHGDITQGWKNAMPFVYRLHDSLALGSVGGYALGVAALLWTLDCFVGFYLTLPPRKARAGDAPSNRARGWWARWSPAWKLRWNGGGGKRVFDLHRAGGLWVWAMLFVLAWSSVGFNLSEAYRPVMRALGHVESAAAAPRLPQPLWQPAIGWEQARRLAALALAQRAGRDGFAVRRERLIHYDPDRGVYEYRTLSTLDVGSRLGNTTVFIDATTGATLSFRLPTSRSAANTVDTWITALHTAAIGGLPMQVFISFMGLVVTTLSVTGACIWWKRRKARLAAAV